MTNSSHTLTVQHEVSNWYISAMCGHRTVSNLIEFILLCHGTFKDTSLNTVSNTTMTYSEEQLPVLAQICYDSLLLAQICYDSLLLAQMTTADCHNIFKVDKM
jgi:hypothetical protein